MPSLDKWSRIAVLLATSNADCRSMNVVTLLLSSVAINLAKQSFVLFPSIKSYETLYILSPKINLILFNIILSSTLQRQDESEIGRTLLLLALGMGIMMLNVHFLGNIPSFRLKVSNVKIGF